MLEPGLDRHEWESRWASLQRSSRTHRATRCQSSTVALAIDDYRSVYEYLIEERTSP
jgi:hypothetical protein